MKDKKISVCRWCGEPLVFTFMFDGAEYYCLNCHGSYGYCDSNLTELTPELEYKHRLYKKIFRTLGKDIIPYGVQRTNCKKCQELNEKHINHATNKELLKSKIARTVLNEMTLCNEEIKDNE